MQNLYVHFPFCRRKCRYCALYSRVGVSPSDRAAYVRFLAGRLDEMASSAGSPAKTVYFGGGSPALCDLSPLGRALCACCDETTEFTVELHPLDVTEAKLAELQDLGVNRISMGVQSLDDAILADMGRGYTFAEAARAFSCVRRRFDNAGIDLIVGYPGEERTKGDFSVLRDWGLKHCSVYSLQNERGLAGVPDDDWTLDRIKDVAQVLGTMGLERYEISNYAVRGFECRHNLAVWRGEDYVGLGEGACGRVGLQRTVGRATGCETSEVSPQEDLKERTLFRLRTREGLDASRFPEWGQTLRRFVQEGLLTQEGTVFRLTERGTEVCDAILSDLV